MNKQKVSYSSRKNKYIPFLSSFILFFSILPPVNAHLLVNNQSSSSQNNTSKPAVNQKRRRLGRSIYKIPVQAKPIQSPTGIGARRTGFCSNSKESKINLINLAPYVGQTTSTHPTFSWYVSAATSYPIEFVLYHLSPDKKEAIIVYQESILSKQGIMQVSLPKNEPGLRLNERYFWYVTMNCNPNRPSKNPADESQFEVVKISSDLNFQIQNENDVLKKAELYATEGFWYDAFAQTLQAPQNIFARKEQEILLTDLAETEEEKRKSMLFEMIDNQFK